MYQTPVTAATDEAGEIEQGKVDHRAPCKGVADAAIKWVGPVLVEAEDVRREAHTPGIWPRRPAIPVPISTTPSHSRYCQAENRAQRAENVSGPGARKNTQIQMGQWRTCSTSCCARAFCGRPHIQPCRCIASGKSFSKRTRGRQCAMFERATKTRNPAPRAGFHDLGLKWSVSITDRCRGSARLPPRGRCPSMLAAMRMGTLRSR